MRGLYGIMISVGLAIVAAVCNWFYIARQASGYHTESFVIISPNTQLNKGDRIRTEHLSRVDVPLQSVGDLATTAILWKDRATILDQAAVKDYRGGEIFLQQDRVTPAAKDLGDALAVNEVAFPVPVDSRTFVPDNFNPGDEVSFFISEYMPTGEPTPVTPANSSARTERLIGKFRILALGARRSSLDVERANAGASRASREDVLTVSLKRDNNEFDDSAKALFNLLRFSSNRGLQVVKHSTKK